MLSLLAIETYVAQLLKDKEYATCFAKYHAPVWSEMEDWLEPFEESDNQ